MKDNVHTMSVLFSIRPYFRPTKIVSKRIYTSRLIKMGSLGSPKQEMMRGGALSFISSCFRVGGIENLFGSSKQKIDACGSVPIRPAL